MNVQIWALENEENIYCKNIGFECGFAFHIPNANTMAIPTHVEMGS